MVSETQTTHLLIVEDDRGRREFVLTASVYSIGRDPRCDVRLFSQFVSRRHATIIQLPNDDGTYFYRLVDGTLKGRASANGVLVNGRKLPLHELQNADEIVFGPQAKAVYYELKQREELPDERALDITIVPEEETV
jgi:pSer/pThr/pTyr-binding forkhead associated (FHA) protein